MQFYDATNKRAICQGIDRICDSDDTAYPRLDKTAEVNDGLEELVGIIVAELGNNFWRWDDTNQTDLPKGSGTLAEGQEWYSFASEYLKVEEIRILNINGTPIKIEQIDEDIMNGLSWEEYFGLNSDLTAKKGFPSHYQLLGDSIRLGPAPTSTAVTLASGLEIDFVRTSVLFTPVSTTAADTTNPGIPSPYHKLLVYYGSLTYCMKYKRDRVAWLEKKWSDGVDDLIKHLSKRNPDHRDVMTNKKIVHI